MEQEINYYSNDTIRGIEKIIAGVKEWQKDNDRAVPRNVALVITKLEEARFWALEMVNRSDN